ncbi:hypothetical protein [Ammoniphilus sp. YIM 78166]|uniref:hypothetical protein n=1 Tax=Ammoniphilus sp. YIM 78166 TaxID=1644106 RepID=UPI0014308947|nr:hypothetical protein [Ammoniphilus sp. YIM 78166]
MGRFKGYSFLATIFFVIGFYVYHVREFGSDSLVTLLALASCISFVIFLVLFMRVGRQV